MALFQTVDADLKQAMRDRDACRLAVLRMLKSAMTNTLIEKHGAAGQLSDEEAIAVIRKELKKREDSVEAFAGAGRGELAAKEREEAAILAAYLPKALPPEELAALVREAIAEVGATGKGHMGQVMKAVMAKVLGRADGRAVSAEVQRQLESA
jgi:uncharacterized protein YqeY